MLRTRTVSILSAYHPDVDEAMNDKEILSQVYLEEYAQELAIKGNLTIILNGKEISLSDFVYGTVLNTETLRHAVIPEHQEIQKIITVENKANYVSMPYEEGTLIVFSHGFFSPLEPARRYSNPEDHRAAGLCRPQNCRIKQKSPGGCRGSLSLSCICWLL